MMKWANILMWGSGKQRSIVLEAVLKAVRIFKKGKSSPEGVKYEKLLRSNKVDLIGFVPNITYIRVNSRDQEDLEVLWDHKFSGPTVLYHLKDSPFLILVNPNVAYNDSRLLEIDENSDLAAIRNLKGIIG